MDSPWLQAGVWLLVGLVAALTVLAAFMVWRNGYVRGWQAARTTPPTCPLCGYNLSGLKIARCPECGTEYTIDALFKTAILKRGSKAHTPGASAVTVVHKGHDHT